MRASLLLLAVAAASTACVVGTEEIQRPTPPALKGDVPAIGRPLSLDLEDHGAKVELRGVTGRVTVLCVLGADDAPVVSACTDAGNLWQDRITVVGLSTLGTGAASAPFRVFTDPGGKELKENLELGPESRVVLVDVEGRVAQLVPSTDLGTLSQRIDTLVF